MYYLIRLKYREQKRNENIGLHILMYHVKEILYFFCKLNV